MALTLFSRNILNELQNGYCEVQSYNVHITSSKSYRWSTNHEHGTDWQNKLANPTFLTVESRYVQISCYDVIKWKHFPRYWPFVRGIHQRPVNSLHKGQWRGALMFSSICVWINDWVNNGEASDLRRYRAHYDVTVMRQAKLPASSEGIILWLAVTTAAIYRKVGVWHGNQISFLGFRNLS